MSERETRERVRQLVRQILDAVPAQSGDSPSLTDPAPPANAPAPEHLVVNSIRDRVNAEFDRDESAKQLLTDEDLRGLDEGARLRVSRDARFTPLASDKIAELKIELIYKVPRNEPVRPRTIAIGADHGGFETKEKLKPLLSGLGMTIVDVGTNSSDPVDYPDLAHEVARAVADRRADVGVIIDGAGIGSAMTANKVPGVRAAACYSPALAKNSREHNGANVLTLGSGQNSFEEIREIVEAFLGTELGEERHKRRVEKISGVESRYTR